jgi:hypothetical protein
LSNAQNAFIASGACSSIVFRFASLLMLYIGRKL